MYRYYNVHTHNKKPQADCLSIVNVYEQFDAIGSIPACSLGLHPWYLDRASAVLPVLAAAAKQANVWAIGECGLDRVKGADWDVQLYFFEQQISLAAALGKPLIIHCVRSFDEVLRLLRTSGTTVPVIFHGFNNKESVAHKILNDGHYLSLGAALLQPKAPAVALLADVLPADRFFLETDTSGIPINELYFMAARIRKTDEDAIILQLQQNFKNVFGV